MLAGNRLRLLQIAALAGPIAIVGVTKVVTTPVGAAVQVNGLNEAPPFVHAAAVTTALTPEQRRAAEWAGSLDTKARLTSPLDHPTQAVPVQEVIPAPIVQAAPEPARPRVNPLAGLRLTGTLRSADGGLAAINGKVYRVGEQVRAGCRLQSVDTASNSVELVLEDGRVVRLGRE